MSQEQAEQALRNLYEETGARDELTDAEAETLLKWAEGEIQRLAGQNLEDAAFDEAYANLVRLLTRMNRFTARRVDMPPEEQKESLKRVVESAFSVGLEVPQAQAETYLQRPVAFDSSANLQSLIALVSSGGMSSQTADAPPTGKVPLNDEESGYEV